MNKLKIFTWFVLLLFLSKQVSAYSGEIIVSYPTPGDFPTGLTFDGKYLWIADRKDKVIYCIDPENGKQVRSIPSPGYWPMGLTWDGEYLWNSDIKGGIPLSENYDGKIYKINIKSGNIIKTIAAPSISPMGLGYDGNYLWCVDNSSDELIRFSEGDGTTIKSFSSPAHDPQGLTFDGKYLWVSDRLRDEIYMVDSESGCVIVTLEAPGKYVRGLAFDGKYLWAIDHESKRIYKLRISDDEKFKRSNEHHSEITYTHQTTNFGPGKVNTADIHIAIPVNRDNQELTTEISYPKPYTDIITDKWGQKTAHYHYDNLSASKSRTVEMIVQAKTWDVRYFIFPEKVGSLDQIPNDIKSRYLEDNEKYQIEHPYIQSSVNEAIGDETRPYWIARKIFNYLIDNMYYEMTGGWNTAPTVLERGNGSCSEYTFVYISMCRAAGLPARYVGSVVIRGDNSAMDDVFHRWVEVYLPNYGWIPIDPSGGDHVWPADQANSFGKLAYRFLITTQSGGGSETMEWTYNSNQFWTNEPKSNIVFDYFADWKAIK